MIKQVKHVRTSKLGKRFVAGSKIQESNKKRIFIRIRPDLLSGKKGTWQITTQTEGYPETIAFLDDKLQGLFGKRNEMYNLAVEVKNDLKQNNPNDEIIILDKRTMDILDASKRFKEDFGKY